MHFERITYMSKAFDMVLVNKDFNKKPWRIDMIPSGDKDAIQEVRKICGLTQNSNCQYALTLASF